MSKVVDYKKDFYDLWASRKKWITGISANGVDEPERSTAQSYAIKVACRFRPGKMGHDKLALPLHQFIKVKRNQMKDKDKDKDKNNDKDKENKLLLGEEDPEEFLDPFLGVLMKEPVLLKTSNRVIDRSVALQCILRGGGKDPFNGRKLTQSDLVPQIELSVLIEAFRVKQIRSRQDVALDRSELQTLVRKHEVGGLLSLSCYHYPPICC